MIKHNGKTYITHDELPKNEKHIFGRHNLFELLPTGPRVILGMELKNLLNETNIITSRI